MRWVTASLAVAAVAAAAAGQPLEGVWVTSSGAVDTSSTKAMVRDLVNGQMSDEQKVLAVFNWYRRVVYPHNYLAGDRRDVLRQINSYGNTLCGSHAANLGWLMREAGFKTRCVYIYGGGHTFIEVFYGDGWHAVDPETDFAVWSRGPKRHLISMDELKADPTLLDHPEAEGRAKPWLFKAMKFPWTTRKKMADFCDDRKNGASKASMQWSSSVLKRMTIKDYFIQGVRSVRYSEVNAAYGGHVSDPDLMSIRLRPNEKLIRCWANEGKGRYILGQGFCGYPAHLLYGGGADENDEEVFPYVEPYRKDNYGIPALPVDRCYRYSGNGHLIWTPDLAAGELTRAAGVQMDNLVLDKATGVLRPVEAGKPAVLIVPIRSSYALVWADVTGTFLRGSKDDVCRILVRKLVKETVEGKVRKVWKLDPVWTSDQFGEHTADAGYGRRINGKYTYEIRIEMLAASDVRKVGLKAVRFDHTFVNNWLVLPHLEPGENTIRVRLANPRLLKQVRLQITYEWAEGVGWKQPRRDVREVTGAAFEYQLTAAGPKFPRMQRLTLEALPR